jgi:hypothetical protein
VVALLAALSAPTGAQSPLDDARVRLAIPSPVDPCEVQAFANWIAMLAQIPNGFEAASSPRDCQGTPSGNFPPRPAPAISVRAAFDRLVAEAPGYAWRVEGGVVVMRPIAAWADRSNILNTQVPTYQSFAQEVREAFHTISAPFAPRSLLSPWQNGPVTLGVPLDVAFSGGTLLDALNTLVRNNPRLSWSVGYCVDDVTRTLAIAVRDYERKRTNLHTLQTLRGAPDCHHD